MFPGRKGHLSPNQVQILVKKLVQESGDNVMKFSSHSLRRGGSVFRESRWGPAGSKGIWGVEGKVLTVRVPRVKVGGKVAGSTKNCRFPITRYGCLSCALSASGCGRAQGHVCCCCSVTGSHTSVNKFVERKFMVGTALKPQCPPTKKKATWPSLSMNM